MLTVGRDPFHADILIESDAALSSAHFQVDCSPEGCKLRDLGSRHGTVINGQRIVEAELRDGDHIVAGETRFVVQLLLMPVRSVSSVGTATVRPASRAAEGPVVDSVNGPPNAAVTAASPRKPLRIQLQIIQRTAESESAEASRLFTTILPGETVIAGRVPERSDLCFPADNEMSGAHLEFSCSRRDCRLRDLNSTNGTFLNGQMMHNLLLQNGDEIRAGHTWFVVSLVAEQPSRRPPAQQTSIDIALNQELRKQARQGAGGFQIVNSTPFKLAPLTGQIDFPGHSLTLIVRGAFRLKPGQIAVPAESQIFPEGSLPYEGDDDPVRPPRYESDFAFRKPRADILLVGHCHAPGGQPVRRLQVGLQVGEYSRRLEVFGKRFWFQERGAWKTTDEEPFTSLNLSYANSFGGPGFEANPVGVGYTIPKQRRSNAPLPLPLIEAPEALLKSPDDVTEPAGYGPLGKWYGRRRQQLGTYDKAWERQRFPWFPENFVWDHFNVAPRDLQVDGYLRGDELVTLTNLHPKHAEYCSQLPGIRLRCFVNPLGREFREVPTNLDTLWIDADAEQAVLVWRGHTSVMSDECEDIRHVFVISQPLDEVPLSVNECHALLLDELVRRNARFNPPPEKPREAVAVAEQPAGAVPISAVKSSKEQAADEQMKKFADEMTQVQARIRESQISAGVDPGIFDSQVRAEEARLLRELGVGSDLPPTILAARVNAEYTRMKQQIQAAQIAAGQPPVSLPDVLIDVPPEPASEADDAHSEKTWTRARVIAHHASGGSFSGADLSGLNLADLDLRGADLKKAIVKEARFCRSLLTDAKMNFVNASGADFSGARLQGAVLDNADFTGAVLHQAVLDDVHAHGVILAQSWLTGVSLQRADLTGAFASKADLTDSCLQFAILSRASLMDARMARADFRNCILTDANLQAATGHKACFDAADLTRMRAAGSDFSNARFHQIRGAESIWEKALLNAADFSHADLPGTNFIKASLEGAKLFAASMRGARLTKASLKGAMMTDMNLFEAGLLQADLTDADISRSNLYGAEVLGAVWNETRRDGVNWNMTKLADEMAKKGRA